MAGPPLPRGLRAVLFDLDGTLIDSAPDITTAVNQSLAEGGYAACTEAQVRDWIGGGAAGLLARCLRELTAAEPDAEEVRLRTDRFLALYDNVLCERTTLYPGAPECLEALRGAGLRLACVTNKAARFTAPLLAILGLDNWLETVVCGDTLERRKPAPDPLLHACRMMSVPPVSALMVGDSQADLNAARNAGIPAIYVTYGYNQGVDLSTLGPVGSIDSLDQLPGRLAPEHGSDDGAGTWSMIG